jgi:hypothetical protein
VEQSSIRARGNWFGGEIISFISYFKAPGSAITFKTFSQISFLSLISFHSLKYRGAASKIEFYVASEFM